MAIKPKIAESALYKRCVEQIRAQWPSFIERRARRLQQLQRFGTAPEQVAEDILKDLFSDVLGWSLANVNSQVQYADLVLTRQGIKKLVIEVKRPGAFAKNWTVVEDALDQAQGYAERQKIRVIGASDGACLYAADLQLGTRLGRVCVSLDQPEPPEILWWVSFHGVIKQVEQVPEFWGAPLGTTIDYPNPSPPTPDPPPILHRKHKRPAWCFGYVGQVSDPDTWKLPYLFANGDVDRTRLPKAILCIVGTFRGENAEVPDQAVPGVLLKFAQAARRIGKWPGQSHKLANAYLELAAALEQFKDSHIEVANALEQWKISPSGGATPPSAGTS